MSVFPELRMRRLRKSPALRSLVRESQLDAGDLVFPLFVVEGKAIKREIDAMPGIFHFSVDRLAAEVDELVRLKVPAVLLFGVVDKKDERGSAALDPKGVVQRAVLTIKKAAPQMIVITDICLCEYTDHGHCGLIADGDVDNDNTLPLLAAMALSHASSGADMVAPSDMMDGRVMTIRKALDANGFSRIPILSYAAKYASAFYGPFREAVGSAPRFGDRRSYQMDPPNVREALREIEEDIKEGADIVMVKPALAYLDVIRRARDSFNCPLAAYNVSGEYAMVKAAASRGWIDGKKVTLEILGSIKRAGADIIISYHAREAAAWLAA
ncbi:MAG: porphobilinogen synthase [Dehalococcoidia bacterium]|nr:porphobilinogen synthase [Dehalococcoidia bacterium]